MAQRVIDHIKLIDYLICYLQPNIIMLYVNGTNK